MRERKERRYLRHLALTPQKQIRNGKVTSAIASITACRAEQSNKWVLSLEPDDISFNREAIQRNVFAL